MKALTLIQPYATLVASGMKAIETRSWQTQYRGPLAIHAAKSFPGWAWDLMFTEPFFSTLTLALIYTGTPPYEILPQGRVIAICQLTDCYQITADNVPGEPERLFGDYTPGRFAWVLEDVRVLPQPWPQVKGRLGLWEWSSDA